MNDVVLIAGIASIAPTVVALATLVTSIQNGRKSDKIIKATDGLTESLVNVTRSDAMQAGHKEGVAQEKADQMLIAENGLRNDRAARLLRDYTEGHK